MRRWRDAHVPRKGLFTLSARVLSRALLHWEAAQTTLACSFTCFMNTPAARTQNSTVTPHHHWLPCSSGVIGVAHEVKPA